MFKIFITSILISGTFNVFACNPVDAEKQILMSLKTQNKIEMIERNRGVECKPINDLINGHQIQAVNVNYTRSDLSRKNGTVRRKFKINYLCKKPDGKSYLENVAGYASITFLYVTENNSCRYKTLKDVSRVRVI